MSFLRGHSNFYHFVSHVLPIYKLKNLMCVCATPTIRWHEVWSIVEGKIMYLKALNKG